MTTEVHLHHDDPDTVGSRERFGVALLIVADIAFVFSLVFTYTYLRFLNTEGAWMPEGMVAAAPGETWLVTGAMILGLVVFALGARDLKAGKQSKFRRAAWIALVLSIIALVLQIQQMRNFNFSLGEKGYFAGSYSSSMMTLAGANAFHLTLTAIITLGMANRARLGKYNEPTSWQPRLATYWWLWVTISAVIVGLMTTFLVASPSLPSMGT